MDLAGQAVKAGATTDDIDRVCHEAAVARGAYPSPLNYFGFPKRYFLCRVNARAHQQDVQTYPSVSYWFVP